REWRLSAVWCHGGPGCGLRPYPGYALPPRQAAGSPQCRIYVARISEAHPGMEAQRRLVPRRPRMRPAALSGLRRTCGSARARRDSTDQLGFQADRHRRQRLGDRAVLLGVVGDGAELLLVDAGDLRLELEADLRQR